jgi:SAM-dependent methyltransferase
MASSLAPSSAFQADVAAAFAERTAEQINAGAVALMLSFGHRTGLFEVLAALPPSTSAEIARRAALSERYVREWLAALVTGGVILYDPVRRTYQLPAEHAACLTRGAPLGNLAVYGQMLFGMAAVQDRVLTCFETGEGTTYDDYPDFHAVMAQDSGQTVVPYLFDTMLPLVPDLPARLDTGIEVLDAGCSQGQALLALAGRYARSRFTGYDLCADAIDHAQRSARAAGLDHLRFAVRDLTHFDESARYDLITSFDAVHDQKDPQDLLHRLYRALRPGGVYLMQDIGGSAHLENNRDFPMAAFLYTVSCTHCTPISLGQGGAGLGTMWGWETAEAMLRAAGFPQIERHVLPHDPMNVWFVARKP